jgi:cytochrome c-type biogenesis protein CcsB
VKKVFKNPVLKALTSMKLTVAILIIFAIAIAKATFIESDFGAETARGLIYNATWFEVLLGLFCLNLSLLLIKRGPYKPKQYGMFIVHLSMIVILLSAGITRFFGYEGVMPIREGASSDFIWSRDAHLQLQVGDNFDSFPVRFFQDGQKISGKINFDGQKYSISATYTPQGAEHAKAPASVNMTVTSPAGITATKTVYKDESNGAPIKFGEQNARIWFGSIRIPLPYSITLDDFQLVKYPGSNNPASYESHVRLYDTEKGIDGEEVRIYMNHPLTHRNFKHFQSSYDKDEKGTILSVSYDPGKWPTYIGYMMITLGFILIFIKDLIWKKQAVAVLALLISLSAFSPIFAADHSGHNHAPLHEKNFLSESNREFASQIVMQDFRGRMKPLDTYFRELSMKVTKRENFDGWEPVDLCLSWMTNPQPWFEEDVIRVRFPAVREFLKLPESKTHVSAASLFNENGQYILSDEVNNSLRTPDRDRSKFQRKLLKLDERFNIYYNALNGGGLRLYPMPGDQNNKWLEFDELMNMPDGEYITNCKTAFDALLKGIAQSDNEIIWNGLTATDKIQKEFGAEVIPSERSIKSELWLNQSHAFRNVTMPYILAFVLLISAFFWNLIKHKGAPYKWTHPLFGIGTLLFWGSLAYHLYAYVLRWVASGRAPLSNGYESLIFIALATAIAGVVFEFGQKRGSASGISALLTMLILSVAMLSTFDPEIGPLVPVLASYWLNIHVTVITGSYGFLGLGSLLGGLILILHLMKGPGKLHIKASIKTLDKLQFNVLVVGLGLLSVGTLLGGVWANESWGRYWGWDPKETWSLVTILVYAIAIHFKWLPGMNRPWVMASASFASIASIVMTYFGVNYFLSGLHSYGGGATMTVPMWIYVTPIIMFCLIIVAYVFDKAKSWD